MTKPDMKVSVLGKCCPIPLIELAKASQSAQPGDIIEVTGDDPIFEIGVQDFCTANNYTIVDIQKSAGREVTIQFKC